MKRVLSLRRLSCEIPQIISCVCNRLPQRGVVFAHKETPSWVRPTIPPLHDPKRSGDFQTFPNIDEDIMRIEFQDLEELKTASKEVKDIFSLKYQLPKQKMLVYTKQLVDKVKSHEYDNNSMEVRIAIMTAKIHFHQQILKAKPNTGYLKKYLNDLIGRRFKLLKELRSVDYKRFEWLLEKLDLEYKPCLTEATQITRKKSLMLLTRYEVEKEKERRLAILKKSLDEKKVPFLEKKLEKLMWIQKTEKENKMDPTVTDEELENLRKEIEKVKVEVAQRQKEGYERTIHPYYLEPYNENILRQKEEALRREKMSEKRRK